MSPKIGKRLTEHEEVPIGSRHRGNANQTLRFHGIALRVAIDLLIEFVCVMGPTKWRPPRGPAPSQT